MIEFDWLAEIHKMKKDRSWRQVADDLGISESYLFLLLAGSRPVSAEMKMVIVRLNPALSARLLDDAMLDKEQK